MLIVWIVKDIIWNDIFSFIICGRRMGLLKTLKTFLQMVQYNTRERDGSFSQDSESFQMF